MSISKRSISGSRSRHFWGKASPTKGIVRGLGFEFL
jgi:hypothetical protein